MAANHPIGQTSYSVPQRPMPGSRWDPRTRLALGCMAMAAVFATHRTPTLLAEGIVLGLWLLWAVRPLSRPLALVLPMVGLVFGIGWLSFDLETAMALSLRLFNLLTLSLILFQGLRPEELGDALRKLRIPYAWTFILTTAMRYVPFMARRIRGIAEAQRSRGIDLRPRIRNLPHFMALLMPLLIQSFVLSEELAMAMESRGFGRKNRTFRKKYQLTLQDGAAMVLGLLLLGGFIWWERG